MTTPSYPSSILPWSPRQDEIDTVWAADPNQLAADLRAVQTTLGINPQTAASPPAGNAQNFSTVDQRVSWLENGGNLPVAQLSTQSGSVGNRQTTGGGAAGASPGVYNVYQHADYDPYVMYNGSDITVPVTGWYRIFTSEFWAWCATGYSAMHLWIGTELSATSRWDWGFVGNSSGGYWQLGGQAARPGFTSISWEGLVNQGQRIRVVSENGTSTTPLRAYNQHLRTSLVRVTDTNNNIMPIPVAVTTTPNPAAQYTKYPAPTGMTAASLGSGSVLVTWNALASSILPQPASWAVALYYTSNGGLASYTEVASPGVSVTVPGLLTGRAYGVHVWALGGKIAPPHAVAVVQL